MILNKVEAEKEDVLPRKSHFQDQSICHSTAFGGDHFTGFFFNILHHFMEEERLLMAQCCVNICKPG